MVSLGVEGSTKLCFFLFHVMSFSLQSINVYEKLLLLSACRSHLPTCHLLIQANLKCQISPLAFKLTISDHEIEFFNFILIGPLYLQSYKYISGFLQWVPNSPQNYFFLNFCSSVSSNHSTNTFPD